MYLFTRNAPHNGLYCLLNIYKGNGRKNVPRCRRHIAETAVRGLDILLLFKCAYYCYFTRGNKNPTARRSSVYGLVATF